MFYFLTQEKIAQARLSFQQLSISDLIAPATGDRFFEAYGSGNRVDFTDRPYERFNDYERLLQILEVDDHKKYQEIHKGTAFYFLAWTAFGLKDYEKSVFYMDAAISEDIRKTPGHSIVTWINNPAGRFLTLDDHGNQAAKEITMYLRELITSEFKRFNKISGLSELDIDEFKEKFILKLAIDREMRSIITALYSFILEFEDRYTMLKLRSIDGGSIEPFLTHLFKGGLIFESLLKIFYPTGKTIGNINKNPQFVLDFCSIDTSVNSMEDIVASVTKDDLKTSFDTTTKLRNTTGHNLKWNDIFNDPNNYKKLYEQVINAIFYIIVKKYL